MNKRIAKKITKGTKTICRVLCWGRVYTDKYNPTQIAQAREVYFRHSPIGYTTRLTTYARTLSESDAREILISRWPELRRIILKWTWNKQSDPHEALAYGTASAPEEIQRIRDRQNQPMTEMGDGWAPSLVETTLLDLEYYSDRWCWSRVGRMDVFINALSQEAT